MIDTTKLDEIELDGIDTKDCPDFCDAFIWRATWKEGPELTEEELDELNTDYDFVWEQVMEHLQ